MHIFVYLLLCIHCVFVLYCDVVRYQMERLLRSDMHICFVFVVVVVVVYFFVNCNVVGYQMVGLLRSDRCIHCCCCCCCVLVLYFMCIAM